MELLSPDILLIIFAGFSLVLLGIWIYAILSVIRNEFPGKQEKLIWALLIIFVPVLGALLYLAIGRNRTISTN